MVKYDADWEIMNTYKNLQIVWSQFFIDKLILIYIWSNSNIYWFIGILIHLPLLGATCKVASTVATALPWLAHPALLPGGQSYVRFFQFSISHPFPQSWISITLPESILIPRVKGQILQNFLRS